MFDFVRKNTRWMQLVLFILIVPSFVLFGLQGYETMQERGETVAKVDGQAITQQEWDNAHRSQVDRLRQQMPQLDAALFDTAQARYGTLESMVRDRVLAAAVDKGNVVVGDQRLAQELQADRAIASLRGPDGKLDVERYRLMLGQQGLTPDLYENRVRAELATRQVLAGINDSGFAPPAQASVALNGYFETREVQLARFNAEDYKAKVAPTDVELEAFYQANPRLFQAPEQASIEYVVLDLPAVQQGIAVNEADVKSYYEQNFARVTGQEERRASHILLKAGKDAPAADKAKAKAKAEELLAQVKKNPASFAEVAKKNSQDEGSAPRGGDLDFFQRGAMTKPFEDAVFAMKAKGEIVGPVESEFGYHVIQLTDLKIPKQRTFEEMRPEIEAQLKNQQSQKKFSEAADTFNTTVYEQSDSLKPVADKLKLPIRTAANVARAPAPGASGPLANPKFLAALFAPDAIERKRNTDAVEVGPNLMVSGRVTQHTPARTRPLAEVKAQVRDAVVAQKAAELAKKDGQEKLADWKAVPAKATLSAPMPLGRQDLAKFSRPIVDAALRADPAALPAWVGVDLGNEGYAVVKVNKVLSRDPSPPPQAQQELAQYARAFTAAETLAYYEGLKARFKVQLLVPKPKELETQ